MTPRAILLILEFSAHMIQGLWKDTDPIFQLPCQPSDILKQLKKKLKKKTDLLGLVQLTDEERANLDIYGSTEIQSVNAACKAFPRISVEIVVPNSEKIGYMDFVTFEIRLTREHLSDEDEQGFVHSQAYPFLKKEYFFCMLTEAATERNIFALQKSKQQTRSETIEIKIRAGGVGAMKFAIYVISDSYFGHTIRSEIDIDVKKQGVLPDEFSYHQDDLKREPTLIEQVMMGAQGGENSDDDEEDEDGNVLKKKVDSDEELSEED